MKKFSKMIVATLMFVTVFAFVGCGSPAWQQVDTINTNANYETSTYNAMNVELAATGDEAIGVQKSGRIKISHKSSQTGKESWTMEIAGVLDTNKDASIRAALRYYVTLNSEDEQMTANFVMYLTDDAYYVDGNVNMGSVLNFNLKNKIAMDNSTLPFASVLEGAYHQLLIGTDNFETNLTAFQMIKNCTDSITFEIARENDGTTKYRATSNKSFEVGPTEYLDFTLYYAVKDYVLQELYSYAKASITNGNGTVTNMSSTSSMKPYDGEMPTFDAAAYPEYKMSSILG